MSWTVIEETGYIILSAAGVAKIDAINGTLAVNRTDFIAELERLVRKVYPETTPDGSFAAEIMVTIQCLGDLRQPGQQKVR